MTQLRPFQLDVRNKVYETWNAGAQNALVVIPTGGGKTVVFSDIIAANKGPSVAIAHRQELVTQISMALARNGVRHRIIGPSAVARTCTTLHLAELKRNYVDPSNSVAVAGVDTLIRMEPNDPWFRSVSLTVLDEAHHCLLKNKWGAAMSMFPNSRGLGVTATPVRADGNGLGRHADGLMDHMIVGPGMRELINVGWLTDYRIFAPPSDIDLSAVPLSSGGDFSPVKLATAVHKSHIVGDVVQHYLKIAPGKLGVTFAVDVEAAGEIAAAYRKSGVMAEMVTAKTPDALRASILRRFRSKEILQLVNVDLFGEGFDLPAIEVVSMARPTQSYGLFAQQFGRALRPMEGKAHAIIIDHVGNVHRHGLPDAPRVWTLDRRERRAKNDTASVIPTRTCHKCTAAYERVYTACPYCGFAPEPAGRSSPEEVDGDLHELTADALARLRGSIDPPAAWHPDPVVQASVNKNHRERIAAQTELRGAISQWAGRYSQGADVDTVRELQRRFYLTFGLDIAAAQALNARDARELMGRIGI
jgi:DNA repair protein RadD